MIRANAQAEASELKRLQEQVATYLPSVQNQIVEIQQAVKVTAASKAKQTRSKNTTQKSDD